MSNVVPFPTSTPLEKVEFAQENVEYAQEIVGDLFKAHITALLCPEPIIDDYDAELIEYLYTKYSEKFEEYMQ